MSENPQTTGDEAPKKRLTQRDLEMQAGQRSLKQHQKNRDNEHNAGKAGAADSGDNQQAAKAREQQKAAQPYESGQQLPQPRQANEPADPNAQFETVTVQTGSAQKGEETATQGTAPNAGQDTGDRVNRNPANHPDQALVATADNDANAGEEAKSVRVIDRTAGDQAGPMVDVDTTKTGPSGVNISQDNRQAVDDADEREKASQTFEAKAAQDREALRTQENPNVLTADKVKPGLTDEEKQAEADKAAEAKAARDKAVADAEAKAKEKAEADAKAARDKAVADAEAKAKAKSAKKDDKSSAVDDVLK